MKSFAFGVLLAGCASTAPVGLAAIATAPDSGAPDGGAPTRADAAVDAAVPVVVPGGDTDAALPPPVLISEVFGHSSSILYRLNPVTKAVTTVGPFSGCDEGVIDIAIDKDSKMYGTTFGALVAIDRLTARCTLIRTDANYPNSLSFVPAGTLDPLKEALVGYSGGTYLRIDPVSGNRTTVGQLGAGFQSSGDVVSVIGGSTFLTVKGNGCADCLVEINPTTGAMVKNWGAVNHSDVYGLAFWAGAVYGFTSSGELFSVAFRGTMMTTTVIAIPGRPPGLSFWGAGSTTSAPVDEVR